MTKNLIIKKIFVFAFLLTTFLISSHSVMAIGESTLNGLKASADKAYGTDMGSAEIGKPLPALVGKIIGTGLSFLGVIFLIIMIYGGFLWMLDRGNNDQAKKAKDLIEAAIIGLIIVMSAYALTAWLGQKLTTGV